MQVSSSTPKIAPYFPSPNVNSANGGPVYPKNTKANQAYFEQIIAGFQNDGEQDVVVISNDTAKRIAEAYGQAWNVENYLPKAGSYLVKDFAKAILARFEKNDDATQILGCNGKCDNAGLFLCEDGIISEQEAALANINGDTLFSKQVTEKKQPERRERPEESSSIDQPTKIPSRFFDHGGETNIAPALFTKLQNNREFPTDTGGETNKAQDKSDTECNNRPIN